MLESMRKRWAREHRARKARRALACRLAGLESLEGRTVPAVIGLFNPDAGGVLTVFGDGQDDTIEIGRDAAGTIQVNGGAVAILGGTPTVANTRQVQLFGGAGQDTLRMNEANGALPGTLMFGGAGNDLMIGGSGVDLFFGDAGNDSADGNRGDDLAFMGAGDDTFTWDPGDGSDFILGGDGFDTMQFNGANANEVIELSNNDGRLRFTRDVANITMDTDDLERVNFEALGGNDRITLNDLSATDVVEFNVNLAGTLGGSAPDGKSDVLILNGSDSAEVVEVLGQGGSAAVVGLSTFVAIRNLEAADSLTIRANGGDDTISASTLTTPVAFVADGGAGDDTLFGTAVADVFLGGDGDDFVLGGRGNDVAFLGAGDDVFVWNPGDGDDTIEGQAGTDEMLFNGNAANETITMSANGSRFRFFRDVANVTMDTDDVERVQFNALGGADVITVNDLSGTDVNLIRVSLIGGPGQAADGKQDAIAVNGTAGADVIAVGSAGGEVVVSGLAAQVRFTGIDAGLDRLDVNGLGGDDVIDASGLAANLVAYSAFGGDGDDVFLGSAGNDFVLGGRGDDLALQGAGDDVFVWNPGDGNDTIEGQAGVDEMLFNGNAANENIDISANGSRVLFFRDVANVVMDTNDVEVITFNALGGADNIVVGDLSGTDVNDVRINLGAVLGGTAGDGKNDSVVVNGTNGDDAIAIGSSGDQVRVTGLAAQVTVTGAEGANDSLAVNGLAGDDLIDAGGLADGAVRLVVNAGAGDDIVLGSPGDDVLSGGDGDDVILGQDGDDVLSGDAGEDVLIGGAGDDVLLGGEVVIP